MNKREASAYYDQYHDLKEKILSLKESLEKAGWKIVLEEKTIDWPVKNFPYIELSGISKNQQCEIKTTTSPYSYANLIGYVAGHYKNYLNKWSDTPVNISLDRPTNEITTLLQKMLTKEWYFKVKAGDDLYNDYQR